jgi:hypothetical protein
VRTLENRFGIAPQKITYLVDESRKHFGDAWGSHFSVVEEKLFRQILCIRCVTEQAICCSIQHWVCSLNSCSSSCCQGPLLTLSSADVDIFAPLLGKLSDDGICYTRCRRDLVGGEEAPYAILFVTQDYTAGLQPLVLLSGHLWPVSPHGEALFSGWIVGIS